MVFQEWNPKRLETRLPVVLAAVGARRSGKSTAVMHLAYMLYNKYDLVIAFVGSAACCPVLEAMMDPETRAQYQAMKELPDEN